MALPGAGEDGEKQKKLPPTDEMNVAFSGVINQK